MDKEHLKALFSKSWTFPQSNRIKEVIQNFSIAEKVLFYGLVCIFILSGLNLLWQVNKNFLVQIPAHGGTLTEGIIGSPRFVNPVLALSDADKDLSALVYSGLLKTNSSGQLIPDLAKSYTISGDGLTYTFVLKDNVVFQDGTPITADDIVFTVEKVQDPTLKSPKASLWNGVRVDRVDDHTITLTLKQAYAPFIYSLTLGILPKHIWKNVNDDSFPFSSLNLKPVGSGPYQVSKVISDSSGLPTEYDLKANPHYSLGKPFITNIVTKFYQNETDDIHAYNNGTVDAINSVSPENMNLVKRTDDIIMKATLGRVFGIFFNQSQNPVLINKEVRVALDQAVDKQALINSVLSGYGNALFGPLPTDVSTTTPAHTNTATTTDPTIALAKATLEKAGWTLGSDGVYIKKDPKTKKVTQTLALSISTSDAPELKAAAELLQERWQAMGASVDVKIFEIGDLNQNIIRPRKYDALLFGEIIGPGLDLYPFWHSSERNDPGLNIALYTNVKADKILENLQQTSDTATQNTLEQSFETQIASDKPAIFLYSPDFIYIVPKTIHNITLSELTSASDRFADVNEWYIETNSVWQIFNK